MSAPSSDVFRIRPAQEGDVPAILRLIRELAEFERLADEVVATEDDFKKNLFGPEPTAEALMIEKVADAASGPDSGAHSIGYALFFRNFSTFLGRPGIYLEDLYVQPAYRNQGLGRQVLAQLAKIAVERGYGRFEWTVLDWNEKAIRVYESLGAVAQREWTIYRLHGAALRELAGRRSQSAVVASRAAVVAQPSQ